VNQTLTNGRELCGEVDRSSAQFDSVRESSPLLTPVRCWGRDLKASTREYCRLHNLKTREASNATRLHGNSDRYVRRSRLRFHLDDNAAAAGEVSGTVEGAACRCRTENITVSVDGNVVVQGSGPIALTEEGRKVFSQVVLLALGISL
jgi:hypothetical protein